MRHLQLKVRRALIASAAGLFWLEAPMEICMHAGASQTATAAHRENDGPPFIADPSEWDFTRTNSMGVKQKGFIKIEDGRLYAYKSERVVGRVFQDDQGQVHLEFLGHPKIAQGEAVIEKVKNGHWKGVLLYADDQWEFELKRK